MSKSLIIALAACLFAGVASAHPFDDRAEMITEILIVKDRKGEETLHLTVQYRYESVYASFNEAYTELDDDKDGHISAAERDSRFAELAKDIAAACHLKVRGKLQGMKAALDEFALVDLANPDNTVDQKDGMLIKNMRLGYYFSFEVELTDAYEKSSQPVEFYFASNRITMTDPTNQLRAFDDRATQRRAVTSVKFDKTTDKWDRISFQWEIKTRTVAASTSTPVEPYVPPVNPPTNEPASNEPPSNQPAGNTPAANQPDPDKRSEGARKLVETDKERHDQTSVDSRIDAAFKALREGGGDPWVWILVLGSMFVLGGYHAVQPGHGKTLVAGYLIGTQGKKSDAVFLGVVVTAAHTSGVLMLMGGAWAFSELWPGVLQNPEKHIAEWITLLVGATILFMGVGLVLKRTGGGGGHAHDMFGRHTDPAHHHDHGHDHGHGHDHDHGHDHGHDHHHHNEPASMTRWEILRLGILGGIVPCPSAFVIGLIAFQQQWYFAGLAMIVVFSFGLAAVLAAIGLTLVSTKDYLNKRRRETKSWLFRTLEAKLPVFGALVITLIGAAMVMLAAIRLNLIDPSKFSV
ncbi:MAG: hypothetical protein IPP14_02415 [Planctomycetes bacterium]|nr:hypothetical protein [Planctomycetota bacterium]